jgi:GTP diphosphokinase / guanosine-3',5'-bis(diphosphate) 3'-diphosphatase
MEELEKLKQKILSKCPKRFKDNIAKTIDSISSLELKVQKHLLGTALIITELGFDATTINAALLHDANKDIEPNEAVQNIVKGVRIIEATTKNEDTKDEIITKYILNHSTDLRAVIIKLASVLDKMRNPDSVNDGYKKIYFRQAQTIYSEIAELLDLGSLKTQIDENAFQLTLPVEYKAIDERYEANNINIKLLNRYSDFLKSKAKEQDVEIYGRIKSKYSVYNKLKKYEKEWKAPNIKSIDDLIAFRCIAKDADTCYKMLEKLMDYGELNIEKFDDYISNPKPNGYMAIHSLVKFPKISDIEVEVQILTDTMHYTNTYGKASHIAYKASQSRYANPTDKYSWVEEVHKGIEENLRNSKDVENTPIQVNLFPEDIFAFTPKGEIIPLSKGDTALDFAYRIHSQIGNSAVGVKINNNAAKLGQEIKTGDMVEIKTQKDKKHQDVNALQSVNSQSSKEKILKNILKHQKN